MRIKNEIAHYPSPGLVFCPGGTAPESSKGAFNLIIDAQGVSSQLSGLVDLSANALFEAREIFLSGGSGGGLGGGFSSVVAV